MKRLTASLIALSLLIATPAFAKPETYHYDPAHTQIFFQVSHLGFSNSMGKFGAFKGDFVFDQEKPEASSANITIDVNSLYMGSAEWEQHLKSPDFFDAATFPTMAFKSTKITKTGDKTATMTGDFTMLGVTKPVTMNVTFNKADVFPMNKDYKAGFSINGTIKRSEFGMTKHVGMIGDDVKVLIEVEGTRQDFDKLSK